MLLLVEVSCKDKSEATKIAKTLLKKKLIACANFWPIDSSYWWKNKLVSSREVLLSCKTTARNAGPTKKLIEKLHSYEVPVIIIKKVEANSAALRWADQVTKK